MADKHVYKISFHNRGEIYEIFAEKVSQGSLFGFVEVEQVLFGERSSVVVDPSEESLKVEFKDVKRSYIPLHAIVRIDEVAKQGTSRITPPAKGEGKLTRFPASIYTDSGHDPKKS